MINNLQKEVGEVFEKYFGRTSLRSRLDDILRETIELTRWTDLKNLREEAGDLLCSLLAFFYETDLSAEECVKNTLQKIKNRQAQYKSLGRKLKVAIFGGAFDPPTLGHIEVANFVLNSSKEFDEVWLTPCFKHLFNKKMASSEHRLEMCKRAIRGHGCLRVFDYEIANQLGGETYHFLKSLLNSELAQTCEFSCIMGMDNANRFQNWFNFEELERLIRFVVIPRTGENIDSKVNWYLKPPHLFLRPENNLSEISSTMVRKFLIENPERVVDLLSSEVIDYILIHKLYREEK